MTEQAKKILMAIKINPMITYQEMIEMGLGNSVPELSFICEQLKMHGYM